MEKILRQFFLTLLLLYAVIFILIAPESRAEVKIIRRAPQAEGNVVEAQWVKPVEKPEVILKKEERPQIKFSGKVEAGGTGGKNLDESVIANIFSDSSVSLFGPLPFADLNVNAGAYRKSFINGTEDRYAIGMALTSNLWRIGIDAKYDTSEKKEKDESQNEIDKSQKTLSIGSNASLSIIESVPITLTYNHKENDRDEDNQPTENTVENNLTVSAAGKFENFDIEIQGSMNNRDEKQKNMVTSQYTASFHAGYKVNEILTVKARISPVKSKTSYQDTGTTVDSTIFDYGLGLNASPAEKLGITLDIGRIDTWSNSTEDINPIWKAVTSLSYNPSDLLTLEAEYNFSKIVGSNLQQNIKLNTNYSGSEESIIEYITAGGSINYTKDSRGQVVSAGTDWNLSSDITPFNTVLINTSYRGSYSNKYDSSVASMTSLWTHAANLNFTHQLAKNFSYSAGANLSWYLPEALSNQQKQEYNTSLSYTPYLDWRSLVFKLGEAYCITNTGNKRDLSSRLSFESSIDATRWLRPHYIFSWDWVKLASSAQSNNFSHTIGAVINGVKKPVVYTQDYTIQHGTSGIRHSINSTFYYPFSDNFGIRAWADASFYRENGKNKSPFVIGASSIYMF